MRENEFIRFSLFQNFRLLLPPGVEESSVSGLIFTLDCVSFLFSYQIPEIRDKKLTVIINEAGPMCLREQSTVLMNCGIFSWSQAAYQFAHEICHLSIPGNVCERLRWLEETICEASSLYILPRMTSLWKALNVKYSISGKELYLHSFSAYAEDVSKNVTPFDLKDELEISSLEADCYQREKNRYAALQLLPIFIEHPDLWKAVPYLSQIRGNLPLQSLLLQWREISPSHLRSLIEQVPARLLH